MLVEMNFLRRLARCSRLENIEIMLKMNIKNLVLDYIKYKQSSWFGHVQRMDEERLPRRVLEWYPPGRRRKGRPQTS